MKKYIVMVLLVLGSLSLLAEAEKVAKVPISVTIEQNKYLDVSFVKRVKTKDKGYSVFIKFTNKTDQDINSLGTWWHLYEGDWKILKNHKSTSSSRAIVPKNGSAVLEWVDEVASSIDKIHLVLTQPN